MNNSIKLGKLSNFFASARETAREIDAGRKVTPRSTIWFDPDEFYPSPKLESIQLTFWEKNADDADFHDER